LCFAYFVETLHYFKFIKILGWENSKVAKIIIGTSFGWLDIFFYTLGIFMVILFEIVFNNTKTQN
jgi:Protein of unknown function (DUF2809)